MLNLRLRSKQSQVNNLKICHNYVNACLTVKKVNYDNACLTVELPMNWKHDERFYTFYAAV